MSDSDIIITRGKKLQYKDHGKIVKEQNKYFDTKLDAILRSLKTKINLRKRIRNLQRE